MTELSTGRNSLRRPLCGRGVEEGPGDYQAANVLHGMREAQIKSGYEPFSSFRRLSEIAPSERLGADCTPFQINVESFPKIQGRLVPVPVTWKGGEGGT